MKWIFLFTTIILASSCTSTTVFPISANVEKDVCIVQNEKVIVPNFLNIIRNGFEDHGFKTRIISAQNSSTCPLQLVYTATRKWDISPYLSDAQLWLRDPEGNRLGYAQYHLKGGGGFALTKWASAESKIQPVINELLAAF